MKNSIIFGTHRVRAAAKQVALYVLALCAAGSVLAQSAPAPYLTAYRYVDGGVLAGTISPAPSGQSNFLATRNWYDSNGRLQKVESGVLTSWQGDTLPANWNGFTVSKAVTYAYDAGGNKISETVTGYNGSTATTNVTQFSYDAFDRLTCSAVRMNPAAFGTLPGSACTLGPSGNDGPDRITSNAYDKLNRVIQIRRAVGTSFEQAYVTYSYTTNGLKQDIIDANGNHTLFTYDGLDRQNGWYFPSKTAPTSFNPATQSTALASAGAYAPDDYEAYGYDENGNRKSLKKRDGQVIRYEFDALNRMTLKDVRGSAGDVSFGYDLRGLQTAASYPSGAGVSNAYDGFGRNTSSTTNMGGVSRSIGRLFDSDGDRTRVTHPDANYFVYTYDGLNRLSGILENGSTSIENQTYYSFGPRYTQTRAAASTTYAYDVALRLSSWSDNLAGTAADVTTSFPSYNAANQIGTRSRDNDSYAYTGYTAGNYDYGRNGLNQYTSVGGATLSYDANGSLTSGGTTNYQYDAENRLISASGAKNATLTYDPLGRLFQIVSGGATTQFLYDGDELVAEYNGSGTLVQRYVHGPQADDPLIWYEGGTISAASRRSLQSDHLGSVISVADASGNAPTINRYDEFGIPAPSNGGRFGYTGQAWVSELGLNYYKARFYDPRLGRFLQTDPIGYRDDFNLYAYVGNDPLDKTDPSGNCPICFVGLYYLLVYAEEITIATIITAEVASGVPTPVSMAESVTANGVKVAANEIKAVQAANMLRNAEVGANRAKQGLEQVAAANPGKKIQPETYLRDANGKRAIDPQTGQMRRVDAAVIDSQSKTAKTVEITGPNVNKTAQAAKEQRILDSGGKYVRDRATGALCIVNSASCRINIE